MSPIEHVWDIVEGRLARDLRPVVSTDELWLRIQTIWNTLPQADIQNLFNSMPRRVAALIAARGYDLELATRETIHFPKNGLDGALKKFRRWVEPLIQKGNEAFVHHLLMYECVGGDPSEYDEYIDFYGHQCHHTNMPDAMKRCEGVFLAWGVGGEDLVLPEYVGLPLVPSPTKYYMMEIHYDNPHLIEGIVDNSGFRIYYTPKLRKYDAGTLMIGSTVSSRVIVPPKQEKYIVTGHSNPKCLDPFTTPMLLVERSTLKNLKIASTLEKFAHP
ncbi:DBH-like monooxygenase protein 1 [Trichonephila clavipes]|nr:DBH-like monooxygenase protein 1 [Trichonephila clavipes]